MYAQRNYPNVPQGIPPTKYTLAQTGCFITSFCNLESRFKRPIDPPTLNKYLRDHNLFIDVDDGVRDDVAWNTITKYDSRTVVTKVGNGTPPSSNSIVKFIYNGGATHFCLVNSVANGTIIDSWDGKVKSWNVYGGPKAYAVYDNKGAVIPKYAVWGPHTSYSAIQKTYGTPPDQVQKLNPSLIKIGTQFKATQDKRATWGPNTSYDSISKSFKISYPSISKLNPKLIKLGARVRVK